MHGDLPESARPHTIPFVLRGTERRPYAVKHQKVYTTAGRISSGQGGFDRRGVQRGGPVAARKALVPQEEDVQDHSPCGEDAVPVPGVRERARLGLSDTRTTGAGRAGREHSRGDCLHDAPDLLPGLRLFKRREGAVPRRGEDPRDEVAGEHGHSLPRRHVDQAGRRDAAALVGPGEVHREVMAGEGVRPRFAGEGGGSDDRRDAPLPEGGVGQEVRDDCPRREDPRRPVRRGRQGRGRAEGLREAPEAVSEADQVRLHGHRAPTRSGSWLSCRTRTSCTTTSTSSRR